jgi:hypothetical protein
VVVHPRHVDGNGTGHPRWRCAFGHGQGLGSSLFGRRRARSTAE